MDLPDQTPTPIRWPSADPVNRDAPDPKRPKIIQIAINPDGDTCYPALYALRDDGAIWVTLLVVLKAEEHRIGQWTKLPAIP